MKVYLILFSIIVFFSCRQNHPLQKEYPQVITISLNNNSAVERSDELISIKTAQLPQEFNTSAFVVVDGENELASQATDSDADGSADEISFTCNLKSAESKTVKILFASKGIKERKYTKRTQAEISRKTGGEWVNREYIDGTFQNVNYLHVPPEHTDHSWFIRFEGPGWESDKVGYRFYLDWRNAVDIFGKKTPQMVLQNAGTDGFDSYHEMSDWGMDVLKVGSSLGIGSIAMWIADSAQRVEKTDSITCQITSNGVIQSSVKTDYYGWQINNTAYNLSSMLTINGGSRLTRCDLKLDQNPPNLCSGIVKHDSAEALTSKDQNSTWQYLANYGKQSLNNDKLGMAVLYKKSELNKLADDKHSHVVVLNPVDGMLTYYYLAAWELEPDGITNKAAFVKYLDETIEKLNHPVTVTIP